MKLYTFILSMWLISFNLWSSVVAEVTPSTISLDEICQMKLTVTDQQIDSQPNLIALQRNFYIVGTEHSMSYVINQGAAHTMSQWIIALKPRHSGKIQIPAITLGQAQSNPTEVVVLGGSQNSQKFSNQSVGSVVLRVAATPKHPYINQEVIYTVTLLSKERLAQVDYRPPHADDALMLTLGNSRHYVTEINGERYDAEEQKYALFPQKSGSLSIKSPSLHGVIYDFVPRPVNAVANSIMLHVKPMPIEYKSKWLPATKIRLSEEAITQDIHEGDAVTRMISIESNELPAELLPHLKFQNTDSYRVYIEKPELQNSFKQQNLTGKMLLKMTYIMTKSGDIQWPAIDLPWFNTTTQQIQHAFLPAHNLKVLPKPSIHIFKQNLIKKNIAATKATRPAMTLSWQVYGLILAVMLIIVALCSWFIWRRVTRWLLLRPVKQGCLSNNPYAAQAALLQWARLQWPDKMFLNLSEVIEKINNEEFKLCLIELSQILYDPAKNIHNWSGKRLWHCVKKYKNTHNVRKNNSSSLPLL